MYEKIEESARVAAELLEELCAGERPDSAASMLENFVAELEYLLDLRSLAVFRHHISERKLFLCAVSARFIWACKDRGILPPEDSHGLVEIVARAADLNRPAQAVSDGQLFLCGHVFLDLLRAAAGVVEENFSGETIILHRAHCVCLALHESALNARVPPKRLCH